MQTFDRVTQEAKARGLDFLVIGGHAVIAYGIPRNTLDLDLMISRQDAAAWKGLFLGLGYTVFHEHENFLQLTPAESSSWPVDLMLVDEPAFRSMFGDAREVDLAGTKARIPKIQHLIALKLHVYKNAGAQREGKDLLDILELARVAGIEVDAEPFKKFCLRYANLERYEALREAAHRRRKS